MRFWLLVLLLISSWANAHVEVHGHRGARGSRPENTLPAFQFALENGVDALELDIAVSADGVLVISHEPALTPDRCLDPDGKKLKDAIPIHSLKYAEIKKYDCGSLPNERFPQQVQVPHTPPPRLLDLFEMVKKSDLPVAHTVRFNIETKIYPGKPELTPAPHEFAEKIIKLARDEGFLSKIILQSFDDRTLLAAREIEPKIVTSMLTSDNHIDYVAVAVAAKANIVSPDHDWILVGDVRRLHKLGIKVLPWTVNTPDDWKKMLALGVDGIISDYPKELIAYLQSRE